MARCDVLAFAGGAGIPPQGGSVYFLSPELLDGSSKGISGEPNLYVHTGGTTTFVATLEPNSTALRHAIDDHEEHSFGDFQVNAHGNFAVFASHLPLAESLSSGGYSQLFRYDANADALVCVSCAPTGASPTSDTSLTAQGLNIADDGRVFFTTKEQLVLRDTGRRRDAYEWSSGKIELISTGASETDSELITIDPTAINAYFFTREVLSPQDENGSTMKVYDARTEGGFTHTTPLFPCQASDECHGPGSQSAPPPSIGTYRGVGGNVSIRKRHRRRHRKGARSHQRRHHEHGKHKAHRNG
jgi:hypothetical protein